MAVTPHWLESGDRFWYTFENTKGRKFYVVDPVKKTKAYVFDPVKLAASLTTATGLPYDSQHLPITVIRFVKNDASIQFEVNVPKDAVIPGEKKSTPATAATDGGQQQQQEDEALDEPQQQGGRGGGGLYGAPPGRDQKQLTFEYELSTGKLTLLDEPARRKPAWASVSPDDSVVVYATNHNLYMMDAANYAKAREGRQRQDHRGDPAHHRWRRGQRLRRPRLAAAISSSNSSRSGEHRSAGEVRTSAGPPTSPGRGIRGSSPWCGAIPSR